MKDDYVISLYLDTRRPKSNGKYPVKLRLWIPSLKKQMLYPTNLEFTEKVFTTIRTSKKLSKEQKTLRLELNAIENKAVDAAKETVPFTVEDFERRLYRSKGDGVRVEYLFNEAIQDLTAHKQVGTASTYELSMKSIREFVEVELKQGFESLALHDITAKWLNDYEYFMTEVKGRSLTTVSMYVRALRAIFNVAIENKDFKKERYPFGKKRYQVPASTKLKRALNKEQLSILFNAKPKTPEQEKARDFWFLSYALNGMNM
ncbi:MAG TPA: phage integrase SAM-like domain-containing protein, partial [Bacteroidales bacterium]|nr:phage integrase SAM-like domain-containing protein [Bacteroidales bacterium]